MSATTRSIDETIAGCRPTEATPVAIDASALDSTATSHLREVKHSLAEEGYVVDELALDATFESDRPLAVQDEVDRIRSHVAAAAFLGAATLEVRVHGVEDPTSIGPALDATSERADREGVTLVVTPVGGD